MNIYFHNSSNIDTNDGNNYICTFLRLKEVLNRLVELRIRNYIFQVIFISIRGPIELITGVKINFHKPTRYTGSNVFYMG